MRKQNLNQWTTQKIEKQNNFKWWLIKKKFEYKELILQMNYRFIDYKKIFKKKIKSLMACIIDIPPELHKWDYKLYNRSLVPDIENQLQEVQHEIKSSEECAIMMATAPISLMPLSPKTILSKVVALFFG